MSIVYSQRRMSSGASVYSSGDGYSYYGETSAAPSLSRGESISNFLYDLNAAIAPRKIRLEAVAFALEFFNHQDVDAHDEELALGAANVLLSKLAYAFSVHPLDDEVYQIATSMSLILGGASRSAVTKAFDEAGKSVIPLIVDMIRPPLNCHPLAVNRMISVLRYFSRALTAIVPMAHSPGLLDALIFHIQRPQTNDETKIGAEEFQSDVQRRIDSFATLVNLACAEENKYLMAHQAVLLREICKSANTDPVAQVREHAATVLMNLAYHEPNQSDLAQNPLILDTLVVLMADSHVPTRKYASAALFTLACVLQNAAIMTSHRGGSILESLRVVLIEDTSDEARINAAEALNVFARNVAIVDETNSSQLIPTTTTETGLDALLLDDEDESLDQKPSALTLTPVECIANHPGLLDALAQAVLNDDHPEVRNFAARALEGLAMTLHFPSQAHSALLTALVEASAWTGTSSVASAFWEQSKHDQNRLVLVQHPALLDALAQLALLQALDVQHVRGPAISAIEQLAQEPKCRSPLAQHEGIMMALTRATFANDEDDLDDPLGNTQLIKSALKNLTLAS